MIQIIIKCFGKTLAFKKYIYTLCIVMISKATLYFNTCIYQNTHWSMVVNPFTLRAAKRGLTILEIFPLQKHFFENI